MKYIELRISKKAGFWRYKVEVELDLQPQPQASHIKEIIIAGKSHYKTTSTGIKESYNSIILCIAGSNLYFYEDPTISGYIHNCDLCPSIYLTKSYWERIEFYLKYDIDINKVINIFEDLDYKIDEMVQAPGTPAFNYLQTGTKYIKLGISKRAGFWRYKIEVELNLQSQPQASFVKNIDIGGNSLGGITKTGVRVFHKSLFLGIADSRLYSFEDLANNDCNYSYCLCSPTYLTKPYQKKIEFYLEYDVDINRVIGAFENLDNEIDKMVQALGTPAFDYFLNETKYIKLKVSKKAGFWRYKVEVELDLQFQPQAPYMKEIFINAKYCDDLSKVEVLEEYGLIILVIADSLLYRCEDPGDDSYDFSYSLCHLVYLTKPYQKRIEFYLYYKANIDKVIDAFRDLDNEIDKMVQAPGTPAFNYFLNETKYIKLRISKKAGFWRYKVEVELDLQPQPQAPYIEGIVVEGKIHHLVVETGVKEGYSLIYLEIADSELYHCEDPTDNSSTYTYSLCHPVYLTKPYQEKVEFYLKYDVDINKVINAFKDLDNRIDEMVRASGTPAFNYSQTETKYIKLKISKKAGFWRYKVEVEFSLQFQLRVPYIKGINIKGMDSQRVETGVSENGGLIVLDIVDSKLYSCENPMDNSHTDLYNLYPLVQRKIEFYLKYDVDISKVISAFKDLDNVVDRKVQMSNISTI